MHHFSDSQKSKPRSGAQDELLIQDKATEVHDHHLPYVSQLFREEGYTTLSIYQKKLFDNFQQVREFSEKLSKLAPFSSRSSLFLSVICIAR